MSAKSSDQRWMWMAVGLLAGLSISYLWPHEPALAATADRSEKYAMVTTTTSLGGPEAVFVLDFLTGRLRGAVLNVQSKTFTQAYARSIAQDFATDTDADPQYVMVAGNAQLTATGRNKPASSVIYVAELNTGTVVAYAFPYQTNPRRPIEQPLQPVDFFKFREVAAE